MRVPPPLDTSRQKSRISSGPGRVCGANTCEKLRAKPRSFIRRESSGPSGVRSSVEYA